jgi:hypothetical protein|tara:strand:+ start:810 stop:1097 length:288 start_codon:yes stop_codon:yes gene_type:complete
MTYLKWKLSDEGTWGTGPEGTIDARGGHAEASWAVDGDGYRIGYLTQTANLDGLEVWDVTTQTEAEALTFCQALDAEAEVLPDGRISGPEPDVAE